MNIALHSVSARFMILLSLVLVALALSPLPRLSADPLPANIGTDLVRLYEAFTTHPQRANAIAESHVMTLVGNRALVMIIAADLPSADTIVSTLGTMQIAVTARYRTWIDALVPIDLLPIVAGLPGVALVRTPSPLVQDTTPAIDSLPFARTGTQITQGVEQSNADAWHAAGYRGQGVRIGIIDAGFTGYELRQAEGELPAVIPLWTALGTVNQPHGTAVAEILHDMAPEAELNFAIAETETQWASLIDAYSGGGIDVITASLATCYSEPGDGYDYDLPALDYANLSSAIADAHARNVVYINSAGNTSTRHWDGYYSDTNENGVHEFNATDEYITLGQVGPGILIALGLRWDDWFEPNRQEANDYDLYIQAFVNGEWQIIERSEIRQRDLLQAAPPLEYFYFYTSLPATEYRITITRPAGSGTNVLSLLACKGPAFQNAGTSERSIADPGAAEHSITAAAVDVLTWAREYYSARGRTYGYGGVIEGGRMQPRIAGYANVDTAAYGARRFNGTSSAAPHIAGAAALVLSAVPEAFTDEVQTFLESRAVQQGSADWNTELGYGVLYLGEPSFGCNPADVVTLVSRTLLGGQYNPSFINSTPLSPYAVSSDGRYTAFVTAGNFAASDEVPPDQPVHDADDVYIFDRQTCQIEMITNAGYYGALNADGLTLAYESDAAPPNWIYTPHHTDIFRVDFDTNVISPVSPSINTDNPQGGNSWDSIPAISGDGNQIVFTSSSDDLVPGDTAMTSDVFVYNATDGTIRMVSTDVNGIQANSYSGMAGISSDGRYIAFWSTASNLTSDATGAWTVFVKDLQTGGVVRVPMEFLAGGTPPDLSEHGDYVVFAAYSLTHDPSTKHVYLFDRAANTLERISPASSAVSGGISDTPTISDDGQFIAFQSAYRSYYDVGSAQVWMIDRVMERSYIVSRSADGIMGSGGDPAYGMAMLPAISGNGAYVSYVSYANNLVPGDTNLNWDVFSTRWAGITGLTPEPADMLVTLSIRGYPAPPHASLSLPVHLVIRDAGGTVVYDETVTTDTDGSTLITLPTGSYTVWAKTANRLAETMPVSLIAGGNDITLNLPRGGDTDGNNRVDLIDFSLLAATFGKGQGEVGYDSRADFNGDRVVSLLDFSWLAASFAQAGA